MQMNKEESKPMSLMRRATPYVLALAGTAGVLTLLYWLLDSCGCFTH